MKKLSFTLICLSLIGCSVFSNVQQNTSSHSDLLIELQRGGGFGPYPVYNLTIYSDGKVEYEGISFVKIEEKRNSQINSNKMRELIGAIESIEFFSLRDQYPPSVTDMPFIQLSITLDGQNHTVQHYGSLACGAEEILEKLCELERKIDTIVNSSQWTSFE